MLKVFQHDDTDADVLADLLEEINELYEASEQYLMELEATPDDTELLRSLFRSVHTIKGDLGLVNFTPMLPILQRVEDLLDLLRKGEIRYSHTMSDLVLLSLDRVKNFVENCIREGNTSYDEELLGLVERQITKIKPNNSDQHEKLLHDCVLLLNPKLDFQAEMAESSDSTETSVDSVQPNNSAPLKAQAPVSAPVVDNTGSPTVFFNELGFTKPLTPQQENDLRFFREIMVPVEQRSRYWEGRCDRVAKLALLLNRLAKSPVDETQLAVACYVHDFGMAFMPLELLYKIEPLEQLEFNLLRSHVFKSAKLLEHLSEWNEARRIVMQHHERLDGTGYPMGLKEKDICEGAKLLAIVDTFDAMTHPRNHDANRPISKKQAVIEINKICEGQLCPKWMKVFNSAMAKLLQRA